MRLAMSWWNGGGEIARVPSPAGARRRQAQELGEQPISRLQERLLGQPRVEAADAARQHLQKRAVERRRSLGELDEHRPRHQAELAAVERRDIGRSG
jgi:hypothetical protein